MKDKILDKLDTIFEILGKVLLGLLILSVTVCFFACGALGIKGTALVDSLNGPDSSEITSQQSTSFVDSTGLVHDCLVVTTKTGGVTMDCTD